MKVTCLARRLSGFSDCSGNDVPQGNFGGHVIGSSRSCPVGRTSGSCDQLGRSQMITENKVQRDLAESNRSYKKVTGQRNGIEGDNSYGNISSHAVGGESDTSCGKFTGAVHKN